MADPSHGIVFNYTPRQNTRMNQVVFWLSMSVRKPFKRCNFTFIEHLTAKVLVFNWTFEGKTLEALPKAMLNRGVRAVSGAPEARSG